MVTSVIETPRNSTNKYEFDKKRLVFKLDRSLFSWVHYPTDYGLFHKRWPKTVIHSTSLCLEKPHISGCVYESQPVGLFRMVNEGKPDEKILAVAAGNPRLVGISDYPDLQPHVLKEIEHFFSVYKSLEASKRKCRDGAVSRLQER